MNDVFRSHNVVVRSVPANDRTRWVVTFDNYSIGHGFDRPGFGEDFLRQNGVSAIHIMGRREDWYQYPEMDTALAAAKSALSGAGTVVTYGSSMGAYAAIRFADRVGAHAALAISPQYSIDNAKVPTETRWPQDSRRINFLPSLDGKISCSIIPLVIYDPTGLDEIHARLIARDTPIKTLPIRYSGHPSTTFLAETGLLSKTLFDLLTRSLDVDALRREIRIKRHESTVYLSQLAHASRKGRADRSLRIARHAVDLDPTSPLALTNLAKLLSAQNKHDEALELHSKAAVLTNNYFTYMIGYADALAAAGRYTEALSYARRVTKVTEAGVLANIRGWHGLIARAAGEIEEAEAAFKTAIDLDPGSESYPKMLRDLRVQTTQSSFKRLAIRLGYLVFQGQRRLRSSYSSKRRRES